VRAPARLVPALVALASLPAPACGRQHDAPGAAREKPAPAAGEATTVQLCDGHTTTEIPAGAPATRETGERVARELMAQWAARHPERGWASDPEPAHAIVPSFDNSGLVAADGTQGAGGVYGHVTELDVLTWSRETDRFVAEGDRVFHDADALGSTIGVSCDMCHPHAANTHPETYPKFQVQLGRVALLRDMINWCLEHPVRAPRMDPDDPRMRAMEAYIYGQRHGTPLAHGRR
jgi:hypothetical protein